MTAIIFMSLLGAVLIPLGAGLMDTAAMMSAQSLIGAALGACGAILIIYAVGMTFVRLADAVQNMQERRAEIDAITPRIRELEAIHRLTPDQLAVVPRMDYMAKITQHTTRATDGKFITSVWFATPGGDVPIEFVQEFLATGGVNFLRPIRSFSEGTDQYQYARMFTDWLRVQGLAFGGETSKAGQAAAWVSDTMRREVLNLFDVSLEI